MSNAVPTIDLAGWFAGTDRAEVAAQVDAFQEVGFLVVTGHGVKRRYAVSVAGPSGIPRHDAEARR